MKTIGNRTYDQKPATGFPNYFLKKNYLWKKKMWLRLSILYLLIQSITPNIFGQYHISQNCTDAWEALIDLKLNTADSLINEELISNPDNLYAHYLAHTCDSYRLIINHSKAGYNDLVKKYNHRMDIMEDKFKDSPYYLFCLSEMQLQTGMFNIIYGDRLTGLRRAYSAYNKTYKNIKEYPDFMGSYKLDGIFNVAISNLPPFVSWAAKTFGVTGDEITGYNILNDYYNYYSKTPGLKQEAALYNILAFKLNKDPDRAYSFIFDMDTNISNSRLIKYFHANVAYRSGKNKEAFEIISTFNPEESEVMFRGYYYLMGKILLQQLNPSAIDYFRKYLTNKPEKQYLKEINYALGLSFFLKGDTLKFLDHKKLACESGNEITERDREAIYDCKLDYLPDINLLKAGLSLDGGYLSKCKYYINEYIKYKGKHDSKSPYNLGFMLINGKYNAMTGDTLPAVDLFREVINEGSDENYYFASEAVLQLGLIYENRNPEEAESFFRTARDLYDSDYYEYIDEIAKKKLKMSGK